MKHHNYLLAVGALLITQPMAYAQSYTATDERIERVALFPESFFPRNISTNPEHFFDKLKSNPRPSEAKVLAIGDSWFAYPHDWPVIEPSAPSNILTNLCYVADEDRVQKLSILSLSNSGEILSNMAGLAKYNVIDEVEAVQRNVNVFQTIGQCMRRMNYLHQNFDYVLLSAGGNDLLSNARLADIFNHQMCADPDDPVSSLKPSDYQETMDHIMHAYSVLVSYLLASDPKTIVITHTYDQFFPKPVGASFGSTPLTGPLYTVGKGGWFYPVAMTYNVTDHNKQRDLAKALLKIFEDRLVALSKEPQFGGRFHVIKTQGSMAELAVNDSGTTPTKESSYWLNEIHLVPRGYNYVARKFCNEMRKAKGLPELANKYPK